MREISKNHLWGLIALAFWGLSFLFSRYLLGFTLIAGFIWIWEGLMSHKKA
jgi:hypothetical protein